MQTTLSSRNRRNLGAAVLLLALALVPVVVLGPAVRPSGSPSPAATGSARIGAGSPTATATLPTPTARPTPVPSIDLAAVEREIARIEAQVIALRGLERIGPVENRLVGENDFQTELRAEFARANPAARLDAETALYERLGLLPPNSDLEALVLDQLGVGIAGYYRPDRKDMTIIKRSGGFGPLERQVLAHEYTHALQDQHFDLQGLAINDATNTDRAIAQRALVEGDASLVQARWSTQNLSAIEQTEVIRETDLREQTRLASGMPAVLLRQAAFPYLDGLVFVSALDATNGWRAVDAAFRRPPQSSEQVLHPEKYRAGEAPTVIGLPPVAARLGPGWSEKIRDTLGEMNIQVWAAQASGPTASRRAAAGWGGDRVASLDGPSGAWAVLWRTGWDTATDAREFASVASHVVGDMTTPARVTSSGSLRVDIVLASSKAIAAQLAEIASGE